MLKKFPEVSVPSNSKEIISGFGKFFYFCAAMFNFTIILNYIVYEKENKLREGMRMMGLKDSVFWISWFIPNLILAFISTLTVICGGLAFGFLQKKKFCFLHYWQKKLFFLDLIFSGIAISLLHFWCFLYLEFLWFLLLSSLVFLSTEQKQPISFSFHQHSLIVFNFNFDVLVVGFFVFFVGFNLTNIPVVVFYADSDLSLALKFLFSFLFSRFFFFYD